MWLTAKYKLKVKTPPEQSFTGGHLCWLVHVRGYKWDHKNKHYVWINHQEHFDVNDLK